MKEIHTPRQIGATIQEARKRKGLTQQQLADSAGVSRGFVNRLEKGASAAVYPDKLFAVLSSLNIRMMLDDTSEEDYPSAYEAACSGTNQPLSAVAVALGDLYGSPAHGAGASSKQMSASVVARSLGETVASALDASQANISLLDTSPLFSPRRDAAPEKGVLKVHEERS